MPAGCQFDTLPLYARIWLVTRAALLPLVSALPVVVYWDELDMLRAAWYAPLMGIAACALPSAGVPVAGGIVFLPVLTLGGVCPRDAVAFSAATQMLGVGVFAPLNWLVVDPSVFIPAALWLAIVPSVVGVVIALTALRVGGCHGDQCEHWAGAGAGRRCSPPGGVLATAAR